MTMNEYGPI